MRIRKNFRFSEAASARLTELMVKLGQNGTEVLEGLLLGSVKTLDAPFEKDEAPAQARGDNLPDRQAPGEISGIVQRPAGAEIPPTSREKLHIPASEPSAPRVPYGSLLKGKR